jgi:hypothetical protein
VQDRVEHSHSQLHCTSHFIRIASTVLHRIKLYHVICHTSCHLIHIAAHLINCSASPEAQ